MIWSLKLEVKKFHRSNEFPDLAKPPPVEFESYDPSRAKFDKLVEAPSFAELVSYAPKKRPLARPSLPPRDSLHREFSSPDPLLDEKFYSAV